MPEADSLSAASRDAVAALMRQAEFTVAAAALKQLPPDAGAEVAFVGRSNAGKSTLINALTGRRQLARTSKSPGRTRQLVVFGLSEALRLVDLPGYGYASAPRAEQQRWQQLIPDYLSSRQSLNGVFLLTDIRRPMQESDWQALALLSAAGRPVVIVLTKSDKLSRNAAASARLKTLKLVGEHANVVGVELFSSLNRDAQEGLRNWLARWLGPGLDVM